MGGRKRMEKSNYWNRAMTTTHAKMTKTGWKKQYALSEVANIRIMKVCMGLLYFTTIYSVYHHAISQKQSLFIIFIVIWNRKLILQTTKTELIEDYAD